MQDQGPLHDFMRSCSVASLEVLFPGQPLAFVNYRIQQLEKPSWRNILVKMPRNPLEYYRGFKPHIFGILPITGVQQVCSGRLQAIWKKSLGTELSLSQSSLCSLAAGFVAAGVASPLELVSLQEQLTKQKTVAVSNKVWKHYGVRGLLHAYGPTATRDAVFVLAYDTVAGHAAHWAVRQVKQHTGEEYPWAVGMPARIFVGMVASVISHPMHTVKVRMQSQVVLCKKAPKRLQGIRETVLQLYEEGRELEAAGKGRRWMRFTQGAGSRMARVVGLIVIYSGLGEWFDKKFYH